MIPGMNPRQMKGMMKKMGMTQVELEAEEVIIRTATQTIRLTNPQVSKVNMMGQQTYQISGTEIVEENQIAIEITPEDVQTILSQVNTTEEKAKAKLEETNGDLAEAIMLLSEETN